MANQHKSTTLTNDRIIYPYFYKSRGNPPWRVSTSQRLGRMIRLSIYISKSQGEILHGESPQVNDSEK